MYVVFFFKIVHNKHVDTTIRAVAREYQNFIRAVARGKRPPSLGKDVFFILKFSRLNRYIGDLLIYSTLIMSI